MLTDALYRAVTASTAAKPTIWGDPFADDGWLDIAQTHDWASVDTDELFRFMPNLRIGTSGMRPAAIRRALERGLQTDRTGVDSDAYKEDIPVLLWRHERLADLRLHHLLETLARSPIEATPRYVERDAVSVALICGLHPAFIWPEALLSHDRFATIAWFGRAAIARRALLPREVALYLVDVLRRDGRRVIIDDPVLQELAVSDSLARALLRAVRKRLHRPCVIVSFDPIAGRILPLRFGVSVGFSASVKGIARSFEAILTRRSITTGYRDPPQRLTADG